MKILIHIGENKHIVNLLGACTRAGKLSVILEYCPHGSLLTFLRERRDIFEPTWFKNEADMGSELTFIDLTMVGYQVAKGMDFLSSKKVIIFCSTTFIILLLHSRCCQLSSFGTFKGLFFGHLKIVDLFMGLFRRVTCPPLP